jgi:NAD(P)-dependent dehydrogenase (short-subunit alcohol dehydrogenase family)
MRMSRKSIVVTGGSSGFGRITALELARRGWRVFVTVRQEAHRTELLSEAATSGYKDNLVPLLCDITHPEQVAELARSVEASLRDDPTIRDEDTPGLDALLNNAGTAYGGPLELLPIEDLRAQLELNVVAQVSVTQALLPLLKAAGGTIINVSSVSGRVATPIVGAYAASKFALEAISDALRVELAPFGVRVVIIEPDSSPTGIWKTSMQRALPWLDAQRSGPYGRLLHVSEKMVLRSSNVGFPAQLFADTVVKILSSPHPRARYPIPASAARNILLRHFIPDRLWDVLIRRMLRW